MSETDHNRNRGTASAAGEKFASVSGQLRANAAAARERAGKRLHDGFEAATIAYEKSRERAHHVYDGARHRAGDAARGASDAIEHNPLAVLAGGLAIGAIIAAVIPTSRTEREKLGPASRKARDTAADVLRQARESGEARLSELGFDAEGLKAQAEKAVEQVRGAVSEAGSAARDAVVRRK